MVARSDWGELREAMNMDRFKIYAIRCGLGITTVIEWIWGPRRARATHEFR